MEVRPALVVKALLNKISRVTFIPCFESNRKTYTMTKFYTLSSFLLLLLLYSCKTVSKAYQRGDYESAIELGVRKLQKDPGDAETRNLIQQSYSYAVNDHEDQIRILSNSKNDSRYEKIYQEYLALQKMYETVHQYPAVASVVRTTDYSAYVATFRDKAADVHADKAEKWMEEGSKASYREAYKEYNAALRYRPEDFLLRRKRDTAYDFALTKVVISPIQRYGGYRYDQYQIENFQRDILRTLAYNMNNEFVKFYSEADARNRDIEPDQIMELNLSRISIGQPYDRFTTREVSKEVVIKEIVYRPDSVVKQYGTVKAKITTTKRTLASQAELYITVRDAKGRVIWNDRFTGEHKWQSEHASYTGDERALSESDKTLLNQGNTNPPNEDAIMEELFRQIQSDLSSRLRSYYQRYQ